MKKILTLYKKDPNNLGRVIDEVNPVCKWVFESGIPTRKHDGTACAIINGELYKRYDLKKGRILPENSIPCVPYPDKKSGHYPHWTMCIRDDKSNKWHFDAFDRLNEKVGGTYELCGPRIQKNPEKYSHHILVPHGKEVVDLNDFGFSSIREYLSVTDIEGIVFHEKGSDRMCKIRKKDFCIKR